MVSVGLTAVAARRHGERDAGAAARISGNALVFSVMLGVCIAAAGLVLLLLAGVAPASAAQRFTTVAVFPLENLTGGRLADDEVRRFLVASLTANGVAVLRDEVLEEFMKRHRVRYAAGIDGPTAVSLRTELGVEAVLFASVELSMATAPPKVALIARLVSTAAAPVVLWSADVGLTGDDAPGFFELGIVNDYAVLQARALEGLAGSLIRFVTAGEQRTVKASSRFRPKSAYRRLALETGRRYSVAVVPFIDMSGRRNAGEILAWLFVRHLAGLGPFDVVETGVTRRQFLDARIIMEGGLSVTDAETVAALMEADYVLGGRVMRYDDYEGSGGRARVDFSAVLIERKSRRVVWSSDSYDETDDGVGFLDRETARTAHAMATQMVRVTVEMIAGRGR
jgi:TolB-like protein